MQHIIIFFFNDTATTEIYTLSLHDALPICPRRSRGGGGRLKAGAKVGGSNDTNYTNRRKEIRIRRRFRRAKSAARSRDRKSTRLNSSHANISYAVFCLKKKKKIHMTQ